MFIFLYLLVFLPKLSQKPVRNTGFAGSPQMPLRSQVELDYWTAEKMHGKNVHLLLDLGPI